MQTLALHPGVLNVRYNRHTQITPNDMSHHQKIRINSPDSSRLSHRIAKMVNPQSDAMNGACTFRLPGLLPELGEKVTPLTSPDR
ncbi:hypothetical protein OkiPb00156_32070 [Escherichia coli]